MSERAPVAASVTINYYVNLLNFIPVMAVIITGLVLQIEYHMHGLPDAHPAAGLNRSDWSLLHKTAGVIFSAILTTHCILHRRFFAAATKKIIDGKSLLSAASSYYLLLLIVPTFLTAMVPWLLLDRENEARFVLVEMHDKLALLLIVLSAVHIIPRIRWMVNAHRKIKKRMSYMKYRKSDEEDVIP